MAPKYSESFENNFGQKCHPAGRLAIKAFRTTSILNGLDEADGSENMIIKRLIKVQ